MTGDRLNSDREMQMLRENIDGIDEERSLIVASWIVATVVNLDSLENNLLSEEEAKKHWEPYGEIKFLTARRDWWTGEVGRRKKEIEETTRTVIDTNQEGRWQSVKHAYQHAVVNELDRRQISKEQGYLALEWMHHYTEYEHNRAKDQQAAIRSKTDNTNTPTPPTNDISRSPAPSSKAPRKLLWLMRSRFASSVIN